MKSIAQLKNNSKALFLMLGFASVLFFAVSASAQTLRPRMVVEDKASNQLSGIEKRGDLSFEVRYRLLTMKDYTVFDWIEAKTSPDGVVVLRGQVTDAATKERVEDMVGNIGSVTRINNQIEVLPMSENDQNLRKMLYHAVYNQHTSMSRYAVVTAPTIHIIVKNGSVDLRGTVDSTNDSEMASVAANAVPRVSRVTNNLRVSNSNMVASVNISKVK